MRMMRTRTRKRRTRWKGRTERRMERGIPHQLSGADGGATMLSFTVLALG
jgi:hypothetical protein